MEEEGRDGLVENLLCEAMFACTAGVRLGRTGDG